MNIIEFPRTPKPRPKNDDTCGVLTPNSNLIVLLGIDPDADEERRYDEVRRDLRHFEDRPHVLWDLVARLMVQVEGLEQDRSSGSAYASS